MIIDVIITYKFSYINLNNKPSTYCIKCKSYRISYILILYSHHILSYSLHPILSYYLHIYIYVDILDYIYIYILICTPLY